MAVHEPAVSPHLDPLPVVESVRADEPDITSAAARSLRQLAICLWAGVLVGVLVGGVGGRLAMMLLAVLNAEATGVVSDDGFRMGQLTGSGTVGLLVVGGLLGAVGGVIYDVVRPLLIGPRWFQVTSIAVGPAVVVGSTLVHVDGVDFRILEPVWLGIALFVLIPGLYAGLLTVVAERWLQPAAWPARVPVLVAYAPLVVLVPLAPAAALLAAAWLAVQGLRRARLSRAVLRHPAMPWLGRVALTVVFGLAALDLLRDIAALT